MVFGFLCCRWLVLAVVGFWWLGFVFWMAGF